MSSGKKLNVLVVEDVQFTATLLANHVTSLGHSCEIISSGLKAIEFLEEQDTMDDLEGFEGNVDVVITDYNLGDSTGLEIFHWYKRYISENGGDFSHFPSFVMITASHEPDILAEIEASGFLATISKPAKKAEIKQLLDSIAEGNVYLSKTDDKSKILIADASKSLQGVVFELFAAQGFTILAAQNEEETLEYVKAFDNIKMIICSLEINGCTAMELLKSIEAEKPEGTPPVILVTDSNDMDMIQSAVMSGFTKVIQSPYEAAFLKQKFNQAFSSGNVISRKKTKQTILMVDDVNFHNIVVKNTLEKSKFLTENYDFRLAFTASEAMEALKTDSSIKLVLIDYILPDFDALVLHDEYTRYINAQKKRGIQPVDFILISAHMDEKLQKKAERMGFKATFKKPFDKLALMKETERLLKNQSSTPAIQDAQLSQDVDIQGIADLSKNTDAG